MEYLLRTIDEYNARFWCFWNNFFGLMLSAKEQLYQSFLTLWAKEHVPWRNWSYHILLLSYESTTQFYNQIWQTTLASLEFTQQQPTRIWDAVQHHGRSPPNIDGEKDERKGNRMVVTSDPSLIQQASRKDFFCAVAIQMCNLEFSNFSCCRKSKKYNIYWNENWF